MLDLILSYGTQNTELVVFYLTDMQLNGSGEFSSIYEKMSGVEQLGFETIQLSDEPAVNSLYSLTNIILEDSTNLINCHIDAINFTEA